MQGDPPGIMEGEHSKTFLQPSADAGDVTIRACRRVSPLTPRFEMLDARDLRIDEQTDGRCESRILG
jgi:hypothetical protein